MTEKELLFLLEPAETLLKEEFGDRLVFLCLGGAHAYGLETEESDVDVRGIVLPTAEDILLGHDFKTYTHMKDNLDIVVYTLPHFCELAKKGSPIVFEMLGTQLKKEINKWVYCGLRELLPKLLTETAALQFLGKARGLVERDTRNGIIGKKHSEAVQTLNYLSEILLEENYDPKVTNEDLKEALVDLKRNPLPCSKLVLERFYQMFNRRVEIFMDVKDDGLFIGRKEMEEKVDRFLCRINGQIILDSWRFMEIY